MADDFGPAWDEAGFEQRCRDMREAVLETGLALPAECDDYAPGGDQNTESGLGAWAWYWGALMRMWGRGEKGAPVNPIAEEAALAAVREEPAEVELVSGARLRVYPKSLDTLFWIDDLDQFLGRLSKGREWIRRGEEGPAALHMQEFTRNLSYLYGLLVWILTTEGPGLPPEVEAADTPPLLPSHIRDLDALDYYAIRRGHLQVNGIRLTLIMEMAGLGSKSGSRPSWATLAASSATKLGVDKAKKLLRDWSAGAFLGQLFLAAAAERDAVDAARGAA